MSDLNLEAGKFYKTRGGLKARIYATDGYDEYSVHGAIKGGHVDRWYLKRWKTNGEGLCDNAEDLVAPWIDAPVVDWSKFPAHIVAVAMNHWGNWLCSTRTDLQCSEVVSSWVFCSPLPYEVLTTIKSEDSPVFSGDWRDSLAVRPGYVSEAEAQALDREAEE